MNRIAIAITASTLFVLGACGDDGGGGPQCGAGTVLQNGQCVAAPDTTPADTTPADTTQPTDTNPPPDTTQPETVPEEVVEQCDPAVAGKGFIGSPCTKDCECGNVNGALICYKGFYMEGFSFCTHEIDGRPSNGAGGAYATIIFPGDCYPGMDAEDRGPGIYVPTCETLDDCHKEGLSAAYNACGTSDLDFHPSGQGTKCPTASGSNRDLTLWNTCIIDTLPPFNGGNLP